MNKYLITAVMLLVSLGSKAQDSLPRAKNYVFSFTSFNPLTVGFLYKRNTRENRWHAWGLSDMRVQFDQEQLTGIAQRKNRYCSISGLTGWEWRKQVKEKLWIYHGPYTGVGGSFARGAVISLDGSPDDPPRNTLTGSVFVYYKAGIMANITEHLLVGGELNPGGIFTVSTMFTTSQPISAGTSLRFGITPNFASLSLIFRK